MTDSTVPPLAPFPKTSGELITVMAHYHRAEMGRMAGWRDRIDRTTNWAITVVAAMLSLSLSSPNAHHGVLLFANLLISLLLWIEARRYRFFDVYRARVRQFERHYFAQIYSPAKDFSANWLQIIGESLRQPRFLISYSEALSRRLKRNYIWMFLIVLLAWVLKITTPKLHQEGARLELVGSLREAVANASLGPLPGWLIIVLVVLFYGGLLYAAFRRFEQGGVSEYGDVHV